jgi:hypothetical protein
LTTTIKKFDGQIWFGAYSQSQEATKHVIFRQFDKQEELVVEFIWETFYYTAILHKIDEDNYRGEYSCKVDGKQISGFAECTLFKNKTELLLLGKWNEDGNISIWYCRLSAT